MLVNWLLVVISLLGCAGASPGNDGDGDGDGDGDSDGDGDGDGDGGCETTAECDLLARCDYSAAEVPERPGWDYVMACGADELCPADLYNFVSMGPQSYRVLWRALDQLITEVEALVTEDCLDDCLAEYLTRYPAATECRRAECTTAEGGSISFFTLRQDFTYSPGGSVYSSTTETVIDSRFPAGRGPWESLEIGRRIQEGYYGIYRSDYDTTWHEMERDDFPRREHAILTYRYTGNASSGLARFSLESSSCRIVAQQDIDEGGCRGKRLSINEDVLSILEGDEWCGADYSETGSVRYDGRCLEHENYLITGFCD